MTRRIADRVRRISERIENLEALLPVDGISAAELEVYEAAELLMLFVCFARNEARNGSPSDAEQAAARCMPAVQALLRERAGRSAFDIGELKQRLADCILPMRPEDIVALKGYIERARRRDFQSRAVISDSSRRKNLEAVEPGLLARGQHDQPRR